MNSDGGNPPNIRKCSQCSGGYPRYYFQGRVCEDCYTPYRPNFGESRGHVEPSPVPSPPVDDAAIKVRYQRVVKRFTPCQADTFELYYSGKGMTQAEIGIKQGRSQQAVGKTIALISRLFINAGLDDPLYPRPDAPWDPDG